MVYGIGMGRPFTVLGLFLNQALLESLDTCQDVRAHPTRSHMVQQPWARSSMN